MFSRLNFLVDGCWAIEFQALHALEARGGKWTQAWRDHGTARVSGKGWNDLARAFFFHLLRISDDAVIATFGNIRQRLGNLLVWSWLCNCHSIFCLFRIAFWHQFNRLVCLDKRRNAHIWR